MTTARPFIKIPGGKTQSLPELRRRYPVKEAFSRYHEPFLGGGAVFFDLHAQGLLEGKECYLSDENDEIVNAFQAVRDHVEQLIKALAEHRDRHRADPARHFYGVRAEVPRGKVARAARIIYLLKTCFNGLYRVNRSGKFNAPMGRYENPTICAEDNLRACQAALEGVHVFREDFQDCGKRAGRGDFLYLDPPYLPASKTANFTAYTRSKFGLPEHRRLAEMVGQLSLAGSLVLASAADSEVSRDLYRDFRIEAIAVRRNISRNGRGRGKVGELVIVNSALEERRCPPVN